MQGLMASTPKIIQGIVKIVKSMVNYFKTMLSEAPRIGGDMIKGIMNGISQFKQWATSIKLKILQKSFIY